MCLSKVDKVPSCKRHVGYKVFLSVPNGIRSEFANCYWPLGEWITAGDYSFEGVAQDFYPVGFHVFATEQAARKWLNGANLHLWAIGKVEFADVVATGKQQVARYNGVISDARVYVASRAKLLKVL